MKINLNPFRGNQNLKRPGEVIPFEQWHLDEIIKCKNDPIYFIENYCKIISLDRGEILFKLYDCQKQKVRTILNERFVLNMESRQSGKTATAAACLMYYAIFNEVKTVAILANKAAAAREVLTRIRFMYERLPKWLQHGVVTWNKGDIELENGSKIFTAATSATAVTGRSCSWVYVDEAALVNNNLADEFFTSAWPTISSGKTTKFLMSTTPRGYNYYWKFWNDSEQGLNDFKRVQITWDEIPGRDDKWLAEQKSILGQLKFNQEVLCQFLGSSGTLIDASKISQLSPIQPLYSKDGIDVLEYPIRPQRNPDNTIMPGHTYMLVADVSRGLGGDYSAFCVIDITQSPFKLVAKYRDNMINPLLFPNVIHKIAKDYNSAYVLIEVKENGQQIADILQYELEYENILHVTRGNGGQHLTAGFGSRGGVQNGVMTSTAVKRIGCDAFKGLVEEDKLLINDSDVISEISTFIQVKNSYAADEGYNDDMVMCLVLFGWATTNPFFKDLTNMNIRDKMYAARMEDINNSLTPFGGYDNGQNNGYQRFEDSAGNKFDLENAKEQIEEIRWLFG